MNRTGSDFAKVASGFVATPFRLHGRTRDTGLDCVGLVAASLKAMGRPCEAPQDYSLRNLDYHRFLPLLAASGFVPATVPFQAGDLLLTKPGPGQFHLLICATRTSFIHAHAGLGRVVETPGPLAWPILGHWQLSQD